MSLPNSLFKLFGRSPIKPLETHMAKALQCAESLSPLLNYILSNNWPKAESEQALISRNEREADELKKDLRLHLPKSLLLPVSRGDVLELLHRQDEVADKAKDIGGLLVGRKMVIPEILAPKINKLLIRSIDAAKQANKAIHELDDLLESGFRGREVELVNEMINVLNEIEHDTDQLQTEIYKTLYTLEETLPPVQTMFLYKLVDWISDLADNAQQVGGRLQLLLAR